MAIDISKLKAGDVLYDCRRVKAGNTTMSVDGVWECYVCEVGEDNGRPWALISWNGNTPRRYYQTRWKRWPKEWNRGSLMGGLRCYLCSAKKDDGHLPDCEHPAAVRARKKTAKEAKPAKEAP